MLLLRLPDGRRTSSAARVLLLRLLLPPPVGAGAEGGPQLQWVDFPLGVLRFLLLPLPPTRVTNTLFPPAGTECWDLVRAAKDRLDDMNHYSVLEPCTRDDSDDEDDDDDKLQQSGEPHQRIKNRKCGPLVSTRFENAAVQVLGAPATVCRVFPCALYWKRCCAVPLQGGVRLQAPYTARSPTPPASGSCTGRTPYGWSSHRAARAARAAGGCGGRGYVTPRRAWTGGARGGGARAGRKLEGAGRRWEEGQGPGARGSGKASNWYASTVGRVWHRRWRCMDRRCGGRWGGGQGQGKEAQVEGPGSKGMDRRCGRLWGTRETRRKLCKVSEKRGNAGKRRGGGQGQGQG